MTVHQRRAPDQLGQPDGIAVHAPRPQPVPPRRPAARTARDLPLVALNTTSPYHAALAYAARGWSVFPVAGLVDGHCACRGGPVCDQPAKHPLNRHGHNDATCDPNQIARWWHNWPTANVAIRTGEASGLVVVDIDPAHDGLRTLDALAGTGRLPAASLRTLTVATGGAGHHLYYQHPHQRVANTTGLLPAIGPTPGVDLRGDGGYIIAPPSIHRSGRRYQWDLAQPAPAELPAWAQPAPPAPRPAPPCVPTLGQDRLDRYVQAALEREAAFVVAAPQGQRNHILNRAAYKLGTLVGAGVLEEPLVQATLAAAAQSAGLAPREIIATIQSGLAGGSANPRLLPSAVTEAPPVAAHTAQVPPPSVRLAP